MNIQTIIVNVRNKKEKKKKSYEKIWQINIVFYTGNKEMNIQTIKVNEKNKKEKNKKS